VPLGARITWGGAAGATGYKIERKLGPAGTYAPIGTTAGDSVFNDTGLSTQSTYYYRVRATNAAGDGAYSAEAALTTPALAPTPTGGQVLSVTTSQVTISWTANAGNADGFQGFRSVNPRACTLLTSLPAATAPA